MPVLARGQELVSEGKLDTAKWPAVYQRKYPKSWWYHLKLCFNKKLMLLLRDKPYLKSQIMGALVMGERVGVDLKRLEQTPALAYALLQPKNRPTRLQHGAKVK